MHGRSIAVLMIGMVAASAGALYARTRPAGVPRLEIPDYEPNQGGHRVGIAEETIDRGTGARSVRGRGGLAEFSLQRMVRLPERWSRPEVFLLFASIEPAESCRGREDVPVNRWESRPFLVRPGELINDVVPVSLACPPGTYKIRVGISNLTSTLPFQVDPKAVDIAAIPAFPANWRARAIASYRLIID